MTATGQPTPMERVLTAVGYHEPDRVPLLLALTMHGARELGVPLRQYLTRPDQIVEGQLRMRARYGHDALIGATYAAAEAEPFGAEVLFADAGPPRTGRPPITDPDDIRRLGQRSFQDSRALLGTLEVIAGLKASVGADVPIVGGIISPFSLPGMQLGFERYLDLIYDSPELLDVLLAKNLEFAVEWANAQLAAGATFISCADPLASPTILPRDVYLRLGHPGVRQAIARIAGPVAINLASGVSLPIVDDVIATGAVGLSVSALEDVGAVKAACAGRAAVMGNLDGLAMRHWTRADAELAVRRAIARGGPGGGFILTDNHGEIPWQVPESTLEAIGEAARQWGRYPLVAEDAG